jgi:hypothetical protein
VLLTPRCLNSTCVHDLQVWGVNIYKRKHVITVYYYIFPWTVHLTARSRCRIRIQYTKQRSPPSCGGRRRSRPPASLGRYVGDIGDTTHERSYGAVGDYGHNDSKYDPQDKAELTTFWGCFPIAFINGILCDNLTIMKYNAEGRDGQKVNVDRIAQACSSGDRATRITVPSTGLTGDLATGNLSNIVTPTTYTFYMKDSAYIRTGALDCSSVNKLPLDSELRKTIVSEWKTQYKNSTDDSLVACCPTNMTNEQFNISKNENWVDTQLDASTIRPLLSNRMTLQWLTVKLRAAKYDVKFLYREDAIVFPPTQFREIVEYLIHHYGNVLAQTYNCFERTKPYPMNTALVVEYNLWCEHTLGLPYVSPKPRTYKKQ